MQGYHRQGAGIAPVSVFPLAEVVLFPGMVLSLPIAASRYRAMVADAWATDRCICTAMVHPLEGMVHPLEGDDAQPALCEMGCAGEIIRLDDDAVWVQGTHRVRLLEEVSGDQRPYPRFLAELIPKPSCGALRGVSEQLAVLQGCLIRLVRTPNARHQPLVEAFWATADPSELMDILWATLVSEPRRQQAFLATTDIHQRLLGLIDTLAEAMLDVDGAPALDA